jgi:hypothetical protein
MYLGCNSNGCQFANGVIERNHVHHTNQSSVVQGDGIEIKEGSYNNVVRDNVIHDTNYPCILTYSTVGNGAPNIIERNLLFNCGDHAIQASADAVIRNNVILGAGSDGIAMQPHQSGSPSNLTVVHNTVLDTDGTALSLRNASGNVVIANNALFTSGATALLLNGPLDAVTVSANVIQGGISGPSAGTITGDFATAFVGATFAGAPPNDVFPKPGGALVGSADPAHVVADDFNGTPRDGAADVGAYRFDATGNPGWTLTADFKPAAGEPGDPIGGGGSVSSGGSSGGGAGGSPASGGSISGSTGGAADAGAVHAPADDDSGCGCRVAERRGSFDWAATLGLATAALARRRFRRTRSR